MQQNQYDRQYNPETAIIAGLRHEIAYCRICRDASSFSPALPHEPKPVCILSSKAQIAIAGQAPGLRVHETGIPFNDRSGNRLREWMGITRENFYNPEYFAIVPMGFCFPGYDKKGSDKPPRRECAEHWHGPLFTAMSQLKLVLAIGQYAQHWHITKNYGKSLTETVQKWREILTVKQPRGYHVLPLPHPSWRNTGWIKKNPWFSDELLPILRYLIEKHIA
ncbi:MAG: putative uracil-DNA glycosylase protein [Candidatus Tokpelaia sp. JSC189]|nr:MAG: putative uracil-DNA glycosylase protein [Candidatus Tokpelaia sp. JSC189]